VAFSSAIMLMTLVVERLSMTIEWMSLWFWRGAVMMVVTFVARESIREIEF